MELSRLEPKRARAPATVGATAISFGQGFAPGAVVSVPQAALPNAPMSQYLGPYGETYFRIWVSPRSYNIPNISPDAIYEVGVWNAFDKSNALQAFASSVPGFELIGALPTTFQEFQYRKLTFKATDEAPSSGVVVLTFDFTFGNGYVNLTFKSVELFKFIPNEDGRETWTWRTAIHESVNGIERRSQMRFYPRIDFNFTMSLPDDEARSIQFGQLWAYLAKPATFPILQKRSYLTAEAQASHTRLFFDPVAADVREGERAVIYNKYNDDMIVVDIAKLYTDGADIKEPVGRPCGTNWQVASALLLSIPDGSGLSMEHVSGQLPLAAVAVNPRPVDIGGHVLATYDGLPYIPYPPLAVQSIGDEFTQGIETLDSEILTAISYTEQSNPKVSGSRQFLILKNGTSDTWSFWTAFAAYAKGSLKEFLVSTGRHDFDLVDPPAIGDIDIYVTDKGFQDQFRSGGLNRVQIVLDVGVQTVTITSVDNSTPGVLKLRLSEALASDEIRRISVMQRVRMVNDTISFIHYHEHVIVDFAVKTVNR